MDERQLLIRYRAGFYTFCIVTSASFLFWLVGGLFLDDDTFVLNATDVTWVAFWLAVISAGIFNLFDRQNSLETESAVRVYYSKDRKARTIGWAVVAAGCLVMWVTIFGVWYWGIQFDVWKSGLAAGAMTLWMFAFFRRKFLRPASSEELDEAV